MFLHDTVQFCGKKRVHFLYKAFVNKSDATYIIAGVHCVASEIVFVAEVRVCFSRSCRQGQVSLAPQSDACFR